MVVAGFLIFKILGLLCGMVIGSYVIYLINSFLVSKYIGYHLMDQLKNLFPIILISILPAFIIFCGKDYIEIHWLLKMLLISCVYVVLYLLISYLFHIESFFTAKSILLSMMVKLKK